MFPTHQVSGVIKTNVTKCLTKIQRSKTVDAEKQDDQRWREIGPKMQRSKTKDAERQSQKCREAGLKMQRGRTKDYAEKQVIQNEYLRFGYK